MNQRYKSLFLLLLAAILWAPLTPLAAAPPAQGGGDWTIPNGRFYTQAAGGAGGFSVTDDAQARF